MNKLKEKLGDDYSYEGWHYQKCSSDKPYCVDKDISLLANQYSSLFPAGILKPY